MLLRSDNGGRARRGLWIASRILPESDREQDCGRRRAGLLLAFLCGTATAQIGDLRLPQRSKSSNC